MSTAHNTVDFYFDFFSPYSYLASTQLASWPVQVNYIPMPVLDVMKLVNNVPTTIVCAAKRRYAQKDLQRWAADYGVKLISHPDMKTISGAALLRLALAAGRHGHAAPAVQALFAGLWRDSADLSPEGCEQLLRAAGLPADAIVATANEEATLAALTQNAEAAAERGVFGAPTFVVGDDMYFGNDRLHFLRRRLGL